MSRKQRYGKIKLEAFLATRGGKNVGVYRKKNGKYVVSIYTGERYRSGRKKYHREEFSTKKEANQRYEELTKNSRQMKQVIPLDSKKTNNKPSKVLPFRKVAEDWLLIKESEVRKTTYEIYKIMVEKHLIPYFKDADIEDIEEMDVRRYFSSKSELSGTTRGHHFSVLRMILRSKDNHCMQNIKRPKGSSFEAEPIRKKDELEQFVEGFKDVIAYLPTYIGALTGMRHSEIAGLKWKDIDFERGLIRVRRSLHWEKDKKTGKRYYYIDDTKTKTSVRDIIVGKKIMVELKRVKEERGNQTPNDFVCLDTNGNPIYRCNTYDSFKRRAKKLGYPHLRFHDLRHSHATIAIHEEGAKPDSVQVRLGHSDVSTTLSIYTAKSAEQDAKIAEAFDF